MPTLAARSNLRRSRECRQFRDDGDDAMAASTSRLVTHTGKRARLYATEAPSSTSPRLVAAALLSRPPLLLPPLTPFEKAWHAWNRRLRRAVSLPVSEKLYFRPSSTAQRTYQERERQLAGLKLLDDDGEAEPEATEEEYGEAREPRDVRRKLARTVYLLLRKDRPDHAWQFRAFCSLAISPPGRCD
jgi:large subunit ribosomal protein L46